MKQKRQTTEGKPGILAASQDVAVARMTNKDIEHSIWSSSNRSQLHHHDRQSDQMYKSESEVRVRPEVKLDSNLLAFRYVHQRAVTA